MNQYVGKFQTKELTKWLGFDKYEKLIYGFRCRDKSIDIVAQPIFGGNSEVISSSANEIRVIDSALGAKKFIGFLLREGTDRLQFLLFSIENKTFKNYTQDGTVGVNSIKFQNFNFSDNDKTDETLFYSLSFGWMVVGFEELGGVSPRRGLYRLQCNESVKTFSVIFMTTLSLDGFVVAHENEVTVMSDVFNWLRVYDVNQNVWSPEKRLMMEDSEVEFNFAMRTYYINGSDDSKHIALYPIRVRDRTAVKYSYRLYKLINDRWEAFFMIDCYGRGTLYFELIQSFNGFMLTKYRENNYILNTKVLSLKDLAFRKIFNLLTVNGMCVKDMKNILNLPTFLNQQYFAHV